MFLLLVVLLPQQDPRFSELLQHYFWIQQEMERTPLNQLCLYYINHKICKILKVISLIPVHERNQKSLFYYGKANDLEVPGAPKLTRELPRDARSPFSVDFGRSRRFERPPGAPQERFGLARNAPRVAPGALGPPYRAHSFALSHKHLALIRG